MFDLIIIGGGPGGYHMAIKAAQNNLKVAVIEGHKFGGTCLNVGCIPSKAFLHFTNIVSEANHSLNDGVEGSELKINQEQVVDYKDKKVDFLVKGTEAQVKASGATIIKGWAKLLGKEAGEFKIEVNGEIQTSKNLVIATGSKPLVPSFIKGVKDLYIKDDLNSKILTSNEILSLKEIPENMVIVGAGIIGLELGSHFTWAGSKITIIDIANKIGGTFDTDVSKAFQTAWAKKGIDFQLNSKVVEINENEVVFENSDGETNTRPYDKVLLAIGRIPNTDGLGLENLSELEINETGSIAVNDELKTNIEGLYAIGDVNGKLQLAHTAYREAEVALENILGENSKIDYDIIPSVLYARPEISEIGINEDRAKREGLNVSVKKIPLMYSGRFVIEVPTYRGEQLKVIIDNDTNQVIGMSIYGQYASEMIGVGSVIVGEKFDIDRIKKLVFSHPTVHELIKEVINH